MDLLALYQPRANAPLDELAQLIGLPGKLGMDGSKVWEAFSNGQISGIRNYCETDVSKYLSCLSALSINEGSLLQDQYEREVELVKQTLSVAEALIGKSLSRSGKNLVQTNIILSFIGLRKIDLAR